MDRRQLLGTLVALLGASTVGYALLSPANDEELIAQMLDELADALSFSEPIGNVVFFGSHLSESFEPLLTNPVQIRFAKFSGNIPSSRGRLGLFTAKALSRYGALDISISIDDLRIEDETANCRATARGRTDSGGRLQEDERPVRFGLTKADGAWRVQSALVLPPTR